MPYQSAVTVRARLRVGALEHTLEALEAVGSLSPADASPFNVLDHVHFARLFVLPDSTDLKGALIPASLVYLADVDGPVASHLSDLGSICGQFVDLVFVNCEGYPDHPDASARSSWLRQHQVRTGAFYVNTVSRGVSQIRDEARLRDALQTVLDARAPELGTLPAEQVHRVLRDHVGSQAELRFARRRPKRAPLLWRLRGNGKVALTIVLLVLLSPILLIAGPIALLLIRWREAHDSVDTRRPDPEAVHALRAQEDRDAFNPFVAAGVVKAGFLRRWTAVTVVRGIDLAARHLFIKGSLAGVTTIHFARWVFLDERRRVTFISSYDGSLESYMDDFIDKVAWGLNAVFSNGQDYPRTRFLVFDGARDEQAFKNYLRCHQLATQLSYSAYPELTCINIDNNAKIRLGLTRELGPKEAQQWLALL
jgi:hypothetical protein